MSQPTFADTSEFYRVDATLSHLIHFNGDRFLGPYEKDGQ
tara:strand:- start:96 stop:215 length:120 start_codon:yes stop_codon:yes gene_type:complete